MHTHAITAHQPTDIMHRRTLLPFRGLFLWFGRPVTVITNAPAVLSAAKSAGLMAQHGLEHEQGLQWEIVAESHHQHTALPWRCEATHTFQSLYLAMGPKQWFAFDLVTGHGAGFVMLSEPDRLRDSNADRYLRAIADAVRTNLQQINHGAI